MQDCGTCTLCCKLMNIIETSSPQGEYCRHCSLGEGCCIYKDRPEECRTFLCMYAQMEVVKPEMRPDKCLVVFEKINDTLILGSVDGDISSISPLTQGQIDSFGREGFSVVLQKFSPHTFKGILAEGIKKEEIIQALEEKADDSSKLH